MATKRYKEYITLQKNKYKNLKWKHNKKAWNRNITVVSVCSQKQHPLRKKSFIQS